MTYDPNQPGYPDPMDGSPTQPAYPPANDGYTQPAYPPPVDPYPTQPAYLPTDGYPTGAGYPPPATPGMAPGYSQFPLGPAHYGFDAYGRPLSDKTKLVAGLLGILLGGFGAGRFYMGDNRTAIWQLVVTIFTCGLGHFWGVIDGILILVNGGVDAQGRVLRD